MEHIYHYIRKVKILKVVKSKKHCYALHKGQTILGSSIQEVVAKMCQLDKELEVRKKELENV